MKHYIPIIALVFISYFASAQKPVFDWAGQCGNPPNTTDTKTVLAPGSDGQFYLSGEFEDTTQFGDKMMISSGGSDVFLVKNSGNGSAVWANRIGGTDYDYVQKIIADDEGNVIIAGYFYGSTLIGPDRYTSYGSQDIFIAKFGPDGNFLWSDRAGGPSADYISGLALDAEQNPVITGYFYGELQFGDTSLISVSSSDIFTAKFDTGGNLLWATTAGGSSSDQSRSVSCDAGGNILISGSFYYDISFGDTTITTINPVGVIVARYTPDGRFDRAFQLDGTYLSPEVYIAGCHDGSFYLSGNFSEDVTFGDITFSAGEFNQDIFIARYDSSFDVEWARLASSGSSDQVISLALDPNENLYITGHYLDTISFGTVVLPYTLCCGSREIFIVKYDPAGNELWGQQISGTRASVQSVALDATGDLLLSGLFTEEVTLGMLKMSHFDGFQNYVTCLKTDVFAGLVIQSGNEGLKIYPNPATDYISVIMPGISARLYYTIFDNTGKQAISGSFTGNESIFIGFLPSGQYLISIVDNYRGAKYTRLLIKQ
jgi:hypothetical protein